LVSKLRQLQSHVHKILRFAVIVFILVTCDRIYATTKGLSQIVTPDLEPPGDVSISAQVQSERIGNPYEAQLEIGLLKWAEIAVFKGFKPNELIFGTELGLIQNEPWLLSIGAINWSPHSHVDPQPFVEVGYYTEHNKFIVGAIHAGTRDEAILGWAYDFNKTWRAQVDFQSGSGNSVTAGFTCNVTRDFQFNPAIYVTNDSPHHVLGYIVFTYTFHLWNTERKASPK
jgi:hypothetical protein